MKKWEILKELRIKNHELRIENLIKVLLENRGIKTKKGIGEFLNPSLDSLTPKNLGINKKDLSKSLKRIRKAIEKKEQIVIFGDYDADGVTGTAILWETLRDLGANVMPYIPHRIEEGYGLSRIGIKNLKLKYKNCSLIITVDNGIVANEAVEFANSLGIDVIITDHHVPGKSLPKAHSIVHSIKICGCAVAWILSTRIKNKELRIKEGDHLGLVAIATVTDVMKLTNFNRTILKFGLKELRKTKRPGILAIIKSAAIDQSKVGVYELGHVIGPRLNATGRLEHAMDSLRLLCTKDATRAKSLAEKLSLTNLQRQKLTVDSFLHAKDLVGKSKKKLFFVSHESYEPGVIGLIAGRLTEEYYRPSIVLSVGEVYSKASARSIAGFNIIEFIRLSSNLLVDAGGHPMAAGFTVETKRIAELQKLIEKLSEKHISEDLLVRKLRIDCELSLDLINEELFASIQTLSPFGPGNPEPTFLAKRVVIEDMRVVGKDQKHLKIQLSSQTRSDLHLASDQGRTLGMRTIDGIVFNYDSSKDLKIGDVVNVVYTISQNEWNGNKKLELKIKDLKKN